ncbi:MULTISPECIES: futalosine hydrolase [Bacillaceae]|uniref:Futalosine hydrolase n=1 Tax=Evansella alkalicola TaxID=745819 RepID=A0ABS6JS35_9BACI|nr:MULTISPECIES: futalosine hydrolase [Bacillaceae]MBU9720087.1 futalosine hydrolase [Bacillus alkalicola]
MVNFSTSGQSNHHNPQRNKKILIMTAVSAEQNAVMKGLQDDSRFESALAGVGPVEAAINTTKALMQTSYDLVICAGIAGGFEGKAPLESIVIADKIIAADLGAETSEKFLSIEELGFGFSQIEPATEYIPNIVQALESKEVHTTSGAILTLSTVTGTEQTATDLLSRIPTACAEAMEGFGVASAAKNFGIPCLEIRAISNAVGPRDRESWRIKEAFATLEKTFSALKEVL